MTPTKLIIPLVVAVLAAPWICGTRAAEEKRSLPRLVSFAELERSLGDPNLRVLDARSKADYDKGHIPGAVWVDAKAVAALAVKNPGVLTDPKAWESWLAPLGITPNTEVFQMPRRLPWTPRPQRSPVLSHTGVGDPGD